VGAAAGDGDGGGERDGGDDPGWPHDGSPEQARRWKSRT
jgi:hypothetical protein